MFLNNEIEKIMKPHLDNAIASMGDFYWPEFKNLPMSSKIIINKYLFGQPMFARQFQTNTFKELPDLSMLPIDKAFPKLKELLELQHTTYCLVVSAHTKQIKDEEWIIWCPAEKIYLDLIDGETRDQYIKFFHSQLSIQLRISTSCNVRNYYITQYQSRT